MKRETNFVKFVLDQRNGYRLRPNEKMAAYMFNK